LFESLNIALLSHTVINIQENTDRVNEIARGIGLKIHPGKNKVMRPRRRVLEEYALGIQS
jgi:hypothetical protein